MQSTNKFSSASIVVCWLLLVTQHKQLVEELAGRKGLRLVSHIGKLAKHMTALLKGEVIDQEAMDAFSSTELPMSDFMLNSFSLVAKAAGSPRMVVEDAIKRFAQAHRVPVSETDLASRLDEAITTLTHIVDNKATTGPEGVSVVLELIDGAEGRQALRLNMGRGRLINQCASLLGSVAKRTGQTKARYLVNSLKFEICI